MAADTQTDARQIVRFLGLTAILAVLALVVVLALIVGTERHGRTGLPHQVLLQHQLAKLEQPVPHTVFLGDRSLGNAISAAEWQELSGESTANLALTGAYGYGGTYAMLLRVLKHGRPRLVVIMQTAEMPLRPDSEDAFAALAPRDDVLTARLGEVWASLNFDELEASVRYLLRRLLPTSLLPPAQAQRTLANDYIQQGPPRPPPVEPAPLDAAAIDPAKLNYLRDIVATCRDESLDCVFATVRWPAPGVSVPRPTSRP
ncbi:MAG: hypothetical protein RIM84_05110 [Alphaproteobacteria bacterium]